MKRTIQLFVSLLSAAALAATACQPQVVEVTVPVEITVPPVEIEVTSQVEVEVTREVPVGGTTIQLWSTETQPNRAAATQEIINQFREQSGINVELILTDEDSLPNLMTAAVAAGTLPDVVFHPLDFSLGWEAQGILDAAAASAVIEELGPDTFAQGPLSLVAVDGGYAAVPSDGWGQLILYRSDLFEAAGLEPPTTYEAMLTAAEALNDPANNRFGVSLANDAGAVFTQQTFEHIALANGCEMVDDTGAVSLDTPECVEAIDFYNTLMTQYAPQGTQDVAAVRANYFAGTAAMIIWSPFILDEMAGLRDNALPACPECVDNPAFLTEVTGFVTGFQGPSGETPVQYGQVSYVGITTGADTAAAQEFLRFWFNEGYLSWLAVAAEGKFPMRSGTAENPTEFIDGWRTLEVGVDRRAPLADFYSDEVIDTLIEGAGSFGRWGFTQGQGQLVTAIYESLTLPRLLADMLGGSLSPEDVAAAAQVEVEDLQAELATE